MKRCPECGTPNPKGSVFCGNCGQPLKPEKSKKSKKWLLCILIMIAVAILSAATWFVVFRKDKMRTETLTDNTSVSQKADDVTARTTTQESTTQESTTEEKPSQPDKTTENNWETAPADKLYRPDASLFVDRYFAYVFCTDVNVQDYVKMRLGPSKTLFDTQPITIPNDERVIVQTKSVNGWTLCFYDGTEGWIRSDFLFKNKADIPNDQAADQTAEYAAGGIYHVSVTGQYKGEPLNMRAQASRESELITTVPDGAWVEIDDDSPVINGWVWVYYQPDPDDPITYAGFVLYKYLVRD